MRISHNAMRCTLKRYVINNRAIKYRGQRSSDENECHFADARSSLCSARMADNEFHWFCWRYFCWFPPLSGEIVLKIELQRNKMSMALLLTG